MTELRHLLERQAAWQRKGIALGWPENIRIAEAVRESVARLARSRRAAKPSEQGKFPTQPPRPGDANNRVKP